MRTGNTRYMLLCTALLTVLLGQVCSTAATKTLLLEAEEAVTDGPTLRTDIPGYSGTGSMYFNAGGGTGLTFTVDVLDAGYYDLTIRYCSPYGHKPNYIIINGGEQVPMNFDQTGSTQWVDIELPYFLELVEGENTIRIQHWYGYIWVDYIIIGGLPVTATDPIPARGQTVGVDLAQLCWTNPAPSTPGHTITADVYFGTTPPNRSLADYGLTPIATGTSQTCVPVPYALDAFTTYYWVVDCWDLEFGSPALLRGYNWDFDTNNGSPVADAGADQYVWLGNDGTPGTAAVALDGSASTDDGLPAGTLNYLWQQVSGPDGVVIHPYNTAVTEVYPAAVGTYTFRLTLDDTDLQDTDTVLVHVFESRCDALKARDAVVLNVADIDHNCIVSLEDVIALVSDWLECNSLAPCL